MSESTSASTAGRTDDTAKGGTLEKLSSSQGTTSIADQVVSKIAGIAVREVSGVHALGGGAARAIGSLRERIPGSKTNHSQGVSVEVGTREAAIDVQLVAQYGVSIADLASGIRRNVIRAVESMTGLEVKEVNVEVSDVYIEGEDNDSDDRGEKSERANQPPRVQ